MLRAGASKRQTPAVVCELGRLPFLTFATGQGHLIWVERLADVDVAALLSLPPAQLVALRAQAMEALGELKKAAAPPGRLYRQHIYVMDLSKASLGMLLSREARRVLATIASVSGQYYTETLHRCYLVHVHPAARLGWCAIKKLIHPDTAAKVRLLGGRGDYLRAFEQDGIGSDQLPPSLGGTFEACLLLADAVATKLAANGSHRLVRDDSAMALAALPPKTEEQGCIF